MKADISLCTLHLSAISPGLIQPYYLYHIRIISAQAQHSVREPGIGTGEYTLWRTLSVLGKSIVDPFK